jgi:solute carrier family 25 (mitochondrial aspartate/glutamate transporter), member 12/13
LGYQSYVQENQVDEDVQLVEATRRAGRQLKLTSDMDAVERVFFRHASLRSTGGDTVQMSYNDFMRALMPLADAKGREIAGDKLRVLFALADADCSGTVSLAEFALLMKLLATPEAAFRIAFQLFDEDGDGQITRAEFERVLSDRDFDFEFDREFVERWFGDERTLDYVAFAQMLRELKAVMLHQEFALFDVEQSGRISGDALGELLLAHVDDDYAPCFVALKAQLPESITFEQYVGIERCAEEIDAIGESIMAHMDARGRDTLERDEFAHVVRTSVPELSDAQIDVVFDLFNLDGSSTLSIDEFVYVMQMRSSRGTSATAAKPKRPMTLPESMALGSASAVLGASATFPLDKVKTRLQAGHTSLGPIAGIRHTFATIVAQEGFRGLYRGLGAQLVGICPEKAIKLTVYEFSHRYFVGDGKTTRSAEALAGLVTASAQVFCSTPYEQVKVLMQLDRTGASPIDMIRRLGLRGLYGGLASTALRDLPFSVIYFTLYGTLKDAMRDENGQLSTKGLVSAGLGAAAVASAVDTPADCIKSRIQASSYAKAAAAEGIKSDVQIYDGIVDCVRTTIREEGASALLKGLVPRILIIAPLFAIIFSSFDMLQRALLPDTVAPLPSLRELDDARQRDRIHNLERQLEHTTGIKF